MFWFKTSACFTRVINFQFTDPYLFVFLKCSEEIFPEGNGKPQTDKTKCICFNPDFQTKKDAGDWQFSQIFHQAC